MRAGGGSGCDKADRSIAFYLYGAFSHRMRLVKNLAIFLHDEPMRFKLQGPGFKLCTGYSKTADHTRVS